MKLASTRDVKNIAVVGADPYNGNRGVGALLYSTLFLVDQIFAKSRYGYNIFVVLDNLSKIEDRFEIGDALVSVRFIRRVNFFSLRGLCRCFISPRDICNYVKQDYVLDISAGDSFSDIYGKGRFLSINSSKRVFRSLGKKVILMPQTIGPFSERSVKKQAHKSIERAEIVFARDKQSYNYVLQNTAQKKVYELIDVAFFMPFTRRRFNENYVHVGMNVSALLWNGGYRRNNQFGLNLDYPETVREMIRCFLRKNNVQLHLVPHVVGITSSIENDYEVCRKLLEEFQDDRLLLAPLFLNPIDAKNYISGMDFVIGARMHACIAAFSTGVPVFPLAYSRKFNGLFVDTLNYACVGDMVRQSQNEIVEGSWDAFEKRGALKIAIENRMRSIVVDKHRLLTNVLEECFFS